MPSACRARTVGFSLPSFEGSSVDLLISAGESRAACASIEYLTRLATDEIGSQLDSPRAKRRRGTQTLLEHLSTFEGKTWQERWQDSRLDSGEHPVHELGDDKYHGYNLTHGLKALLCLRVIRPSVGGFRGNKFNQFPCAFQQSQGDPLLDKFFEATARIPTIAASR